MTSLPAKIEALLLVRCRIPFVVHSALFLIVAVAVLVLVISEVFEGVSIVRLAAESELMFCRMARSIARVTFVIKHCWHVESGELRPCFEDFEEVGISSTGQKFRPGISLDFVI